MVANTIVVMDEKGGAAKTTLSLLLAQALGNAGYKTCAGDLDGQCNLTTAAGVNEDEQEGIYSVLKKEVEVVSDILRARGYKEEWSIITPYQAEIKMFHVLQNKFALLRKQGNNTVVDYSR